MTEINIYQNKDIPQNFGKLLKFLKTKEIGYNRIFSIILFPF